MAAYDFKANFQNIVLLGATPVLVDIDPDNWNLAVENLEAAIGDKTKAILVSHLHGGMVPMPEVMSIARRHDLPVIEDACQMPGARCAGRAAGTTGDVGVLSFGGSKLLTAGRGGAVLTDRDDIAQRIHLFTQRGNEAYPLSELQAAVLRPQLDKLDDRNARRAANVITLCRLLKQRPGLRPFHNTTADVEPGYYKLGLQYDADEFAGMSREQFSQAMRAEGVAIASGFRALHATHSRRRFRTVGELTIADDADERVLMLHHPVLLEDSASMEQIVAALDRIRHHATMIVSASSGYDDFLAQFGTDEHQRRWKAVYDEVELSGAQKELLAGFVREMKVLVVAGAWCGDCVNQCPIFPKFAAENDRIGIRFFDRDASAELAEALSTCGAPRVPSVLFLSEDGYICGRYGDRTLSKYRAMAASQLGAACPTGITPPEGNLLQQVTQEWLDEFERIQLMLRTSGRLRTLHGD
eukprot:g5268.t1